MERVSGSEFDGRWSKQPIPAESVSSEVKTIQFYDDFTETPTALETADMFLHHHLQQISTPLYTTHQHRLDERLSPISNNHCR